MVKRGEKTLIKMLVIIGIIVCIIFQVNLVNASSNEGNAFYFLYEKNTDGLAASNLTVLVVGPFKELKMCNSVRNSIEDREYSSTRTKVSSCWEGPVR